ncbi:MAG: DUF898 domain-containing protein [Gammaproteobacteria bacterium]|nr:DUF898 domain-containing protein [Gammaproteobacteria bacterium]
MQILRGRILAVLLFTAYALISELFPLVGLGMVLLFLIALPWIVLRALTFRARVSSYRNIRFDFVQDLGGAVRTYVGLAILVPLTLFTLYPYFDLARYRYSIGNSKYGQTQFAVQTRAGVFYRVYFTALALLLAGTLLALAPLLLGLSFQSPGYLALAAPIYLGVTLFVGAYLTQGLQNAIYGETSLGPHRLSSSLETVPLFRIYLVNTLLIVITLGLYTPFAQVRVARYRFEQLSLQVEGSLDRFVASQAQRAPGAAGEEVAEVFDVELGL